MSNIVWTKEKEEQVITLLKQGHTKIKIAEIMNIPHKRLDMFMYRRGIRRSDHFKPEDKTLFRKRNNKITHNEVNSLIKILGDKILSSFKSQKLKIPKYIKKTSSKEQNDSILLLSDIHRGMINKIYDGDKNKLKITYNEDIFYTYLRNLQSQIFTKHSTLSNVYKLDRITIFMLGDIVTNDRIFPEQTFEIEKCVGLQIWDIVGDMSIFFNNLLSIYKHIDVVCLVGNHGRSNKTHYNEPVENNFEYFIYRIWKEQFKNNDRINIIVPETRRYLYKINKWRHLAEHGDSFSSCYRRSIDRQIKDMYMQTGGFDFFHSAHFHSTETRELKDGLIFNSNGCWIYKDSYAWNKYKTYSIPEQWFFGSSSNQKETWKYKLDLRRGG